MKPYVRPVFEYVQIRSEERLATCTDPGACGPDDPEVVVGKTVYACLS